MRTIAVWNHKGGSGKTTTSVNLASAWAESGKKVLVIDFDPQANASSWLGITDGGNGLVETLSGNGNLVDLVRNTDVVGVDLIAASTWLVGIEKALAGEFGAELIFRQKLEQLPAGRWDVVLIDCPPTLGFLAVSALVACKELLVPVEAHVLALSGLPTLIKTVERLRERLNPELAIAAIVPCRVDVRTRHAQDVVASLKSKFGNVVSNVSIRENIRLAEAPSFRKPITEYDSKSSGAEDYRALSVELVERMKERAAA